MPLYKFHTPASLDTEGVVLASDDAAWSQVVTYVGELLREVDGDLPDRTEWKITVWDESRKVAEIEIGARKFSVDSPPALT
jgi:hypothetical protein